MTPTPELTRLIDAHPGMPERRTGLAIVFYHVHQDSNPFHRLQGKEKPDYTAAIRASVTAAHQIHPGALIVMLTDLTTTFDADLPMTIIPLPVKPEWLMYERTRCQLAFTQCWQGYALHIDTDVVIRKSFDPVFNLPIDFAVTWRGDFLGQHINGGMLICKTPQRFAAFMADFVRNYDLTCQQKGWEDWDLHCFRGGQLTLARMFPITNEYLDRIYPTRWGAVFLIPTQHINWSYEDPPTSPDATAAYAWHYKGAKKRYLPKHITQPAA